MSGEVSGNERQSLAVSLHSPRGFASCIRSLQHNSQLRRLGLQRTVAGLVLASLSVVANTDIYREYQTHKCRGMRSAFENLREKRVNFWRYWLLFILFVHLQDKKCQYLTFCKTGPSNSETWMLSPVARSLLLKARPTAGPVCCSIRMDTSSRLGVDFHWARSFVRRSIIRPDIWP